MNRYLVLPSLLLASSLVACSSLPSYDEPQDSTDSANATINSTGSKFSLCGFSGKRVCEARVSVIDGQKVSFMASSVSVRSGQHEITLFCFVKFSPASGDVIGYHRKINVVLTAGANYRVEGKWVQNACALSLVDEDSSREIH